MSKLIDAGADVNKPNYKGTIPLMYAMSFYERSNNRLAFDFLLENNANLDLCDASKKSIKDYAFQRNVTGLFE